MDSINKYLLKMKTPASWQGDRWKDAIPAGNGKTGIAVYGAVKKETILVNRSGLYHWGIRSQVPDISPSFQQARDLIRAGEYRQANSVCADALHKKGYREKLYTPCPIGDICLQMYREEPFQNYIRTLDMESGEISVKWKSGGSTFQRTVFVSRTRDVVLLRITADKPVIRMDCSFCLHETYDGDTRKMEQESTVNYLKNGDCAVFQVDDQEGHSFGMAGKALRCDGITAIENGCLKIQEASDILIAVKVFGNIDPRKPENEYVKILNELPHSYDKLLAEHRHEHEALFHSARLELDYEARDYSNEEWLLHCYGEEISEQFCELLWNYGRYLFISGTREDEPPFTMYGLWGGRYELPWSHNMANINIQMMYWHCASGGYASYIKSVIDYYFDLIPDFQENAVKMFGLDGIFVSAGTTLGYGVINQAVPVIVNWIGGAGWLSQHMYEYYEMTGDNNTLQQKILPFMTQAALFYEQYLIKENGYYQIIPSVSPENTPGNFNKGKLHHMSHANPVAKNATMDIAIIKELMLNLITLSQTGQINGEKIPLWTDIYNGLPPYMQNDRGAIKEWAAEEIEDFYYHRHLSHLYPLFPGKELAKAQDPSLTKAFEKAVELRILGGQSGWSMSQMASIYARLKDGNKALQCLENISRSCLTNSFLTLHNDWRDMGMTLDLDSFEGGDKAPVQLDAGLGIINAIQEMIFFHAGNRLFLLPALPDRWKSGRIKDFCFTGGRISMNWDIHCRKLEFTILSQRDMDVMIELPEIYVGGKITKIPNNEFGVYSGAYTVGLLKNKEIKFIIN